MSLSIMIYPNEWEDLYVTETIYNRETGLPRLTYICLDNLRHSPPDGSPAEIDYNDLGQTISLAWFKYDKCHKVDGPASIQINPENGVHIVERFFINGLYRDPSHGPQIIIRDPLTGEITEQGIANLDLATPDALVVRPSKAKLKLEP